MSKSRSIEHGEHVHAGVLGQFEADFAGSSIVPTAAKPRQVLALLCMRANKIVPFGTLVDEVWGEDVPSSARTTMQTYILQLRRLIAAGVGTHGREVAMGLIQTAYNGYVLKIDERGADSGRFVQGASLGLKEAYLGRYSRAGEILQGAETLWRGPALADVRIGTQLRIDVGRLEETRRLASEARFMCLILSERSSEVLAELGAACANEPMNENLCLMHMLALAMNGRKAQAIDCYLRIRCTLVEELGVEPSETLRAAYQLVIGPTSDTLVTRNLLQSILRPGPLVGEVDQRCGSDMFADGVA